MKHMYVLILAAAALSACGSIESSGSDSSAKAEFVDAEVATGSRLPAKKIKEAPTNMAGQPISGQPKN
jgi:hypothetical protein